jgi:biopolymer transport protein ExbB
MATCLCALAGLAQAQQPSAPAPEAAAADPAAARTDAAGTDAAATEEASGVETPPEARTLADWYWMGGWVMHLILATSVFAGTLVLERLWGLRRSAVAPRSFLQAYRDAAARGDLKQVIEISTTSDNALARMLRAGLLQFDQGLAGMQAALAPAAEQESAILHRNMSLLGVVGNIATMLGLFGTVLGMIVAFDTIARTGTGDARVVAGGIFVALITTAAGLMVGIPAVGVHSLLRRRIELLEVELGEKATRMLEDLWIARGGVPLPLGDVEKDPGEI